MHRKIIGIIVLTLLISATIPITVSSIENFRNKISVDDKIGLISLNDDELVELCIMNTFSSSKEAGKYKTVEKCFKENRQVSNTNLQSATTKNWTWIFYDDADFYRAYDPLKDFAEEARSGENLDVIVLQDKEHSPAKMWYIDENHNKELLQEMGEINMGDYKTLRDFIDYCKNNFSSERYLLSVYNHGGGWTGACSDDTDKGWLTMNDMQKALIGTGGVDIICFTAPCLMGALESVYELRECVDLYIGSEEYSGYGHWFGTIEGICNILNNNPDLSIIEIGEQIIQLIENNTPWPESITMSAIITDKTEELVEPIDIVARDLTNNINESFYNFWSVYGDVQSFGNGFCMDVYDFAEKCLSVETNQTICQNLENIMNYMSEAVIAECHGSEYPDAHGLTIYFPDPPKYSYDSTYADPDFELDFSQNTVWDEFLIAYLDIPDEPDVDQKQTEYSTAMIVCKHFLWGQSFIPSCDTLARVRLKLARLGSISTDVTVSIRSSKDGIDLTSVSVPYIEIPKNLLKWIEFDFEDVEVTPGETYYILCSTSGGDNSANFYAWGGSNNANSYPNGDVWIQWLTGEWEKWDPPIDACFKTYDTNNLLNAPTIIGNTSGKAGTEYEYTFVTTDPNGDDVYYYIEWGDKTSTYWIGPYESNKEVTVKHAWVEKGTYAIRVIARNNSGVVSNWGILTITMPRNRIAIYNSLFLQFLERFPILQKMLFLII